MNKKQIKSCLEHVPIFDSLNEQEKEELIKRAQHEKYNKNEFIFCKNNHQKIWQSRIIFYINNNWNNCLRSQDYQNMLFRCLFLH